MDLGGQRRLPTGAPSKLSSSGEESGELGSAEQEEFLLTCIYVVSVGHPGHPPVRGGGIISVL